MIEIKITIPDSEVPEGGAALARRMAVLGYAFGHKTVPVLHGDSDQQDRETERQPGAPYPGTAPEPAKAETPKRGRPKKPEPVAPAPEAAKPEPAPQANISVAPEHRIDPEAEAQDAADEAAEVAAAPAKALTSEDLRAILGRYIAAHGIDAAQADGPGLFRDALGAPPDGAEMWNITLASKSPETLEKAIVAWSAAVVAGVRYGRS